MNADSLSIGIGLIDHLKKAKAEKFADKNTWASSGPPWSEAAEYNKQGWDECVKAIQEFFRDRVR